MKKAIFLVFCCMLGTLFSKAKAPPPETIGLYYEWVYEFDLVCTRNKILWWLEGESARAAIQAKGWTTSIQQLEIGVSCEDIARLEEARPALKKIGARLGILQKGENRFLNFVENIDRYGGMRKPRSLRALLSIKEAPYDLRKIPFGPTYVFVDWIGAIPKEEESLDFSVENYGSSVPHVFDHPKCVSRYEGGERAYDYGRRYATSYLPPVQVFDPESVGDLYQLLKFIDKLFVARGIKYWLADGSLLGVVRHGGMIPWDTDADIHFDVADQTKLDQLSKVFLGSNFQFVRMSDEEGNLVFYRIKRAKSTLFVDLVPCKLSDSGAYYQPCQPLFRKQWPKCYRWYKHEVEPLVRARFGPVEMNVPNDPIRYLYCHFGPDVLSHAIRNVRADESRSKEKIYEFMYEPAQYRIVRPWIALEGVTGDPFCLNNL